MANNNAKIENTPKKTPSGVIEGEISPSGVSLATSTPEIAQSAQNTGVEEREEQERTTRKKALFLEIYEKTMGIIGASVEKAGISRRIFYVWKATDDEFAKRLIELDMQKVDRVEDQIFKGILEGDLPTARWYLERRSPAYKAKQILEHHVGDKTFEDEVDDTLNALEAAYEKQYGIKLNETDAAEVQPEQSTDQASLDRVEAENTGQEKTAPAVQNESGPVLLLGTDDASKSGTQSSPEGTQ